MADKKEILQKRLRKLELNFMALQDYKRLIDQFLAVQNIYEPEPFQGLKVEQKAVLDAYLKRFAFVQDFLGEKVFPLCLELAGISGSKMTEVLYQVEKEGIIDNLSTWIELRARRNELEHDYPEEIAKALQDLKFCVESFEVLQKYYFNTQNFLKKYTNI